MQCWQGISEKSAKRKRNYIRGLVTCKNETSIRGRVDYRLKRRPLIILLFIIIINKGIHIEYAQCHAVHV